MPFNHNAVKVIDAQGKTHTLDLKSPHHLDHGIVRTTFSAQGETADCVLVAADSTIGKESFYVAASRARLELRFFTTDENELLQWAVRSRAQENPLELIRNQVKQQQEQLVEGRQSQTTFIAEVYSPPPTTYPAPRFENKRSQSPTPKPFKRNDPKEQQPPSPAITPELTQRLIPQLKIPTQPFWTPTVAGVPPRHFEQKHWLELVEGSAIHPTLASRNVRSLGIDSIEQEHEAWEYLMYSDKLERRNTGWLSSGILKRYRHIENGGWWASAGIDARDLPLLKAGEKPKLKLWGCFKPDSPRVDENKSLKKGETEYIKYEHPLKEERQLFLFDVPDALAQRIYDKYGVQPTQAEKQSGLWYVTYKYNLPITLAEGAKKTLSSLSQGKITIGVSGVNGGYYANDSEHNRLQRRILHPELKVFASRGREFSFAFDQDTKQSTVWNVRRDMVRTGELLELEGCNVRVVQWEPEKGKGLDDLIVNQGPLAYIQSVSNPIPLDWEAQKHYRGEYSRLAKKVKDSLPTLSEEAIDVEIYKLALFKGDIRDGARTIAQSNLARSFKATMPTDEATEKTFSYIEQIEKLISVQSRQLRSEQQQPVHQSNEAYYDINTEPFKPEREVTANARDERNGLVDRKTDGVASKQHQADGENRFTREQPKAIERGSDLSTNQPEPNPERVDERLEQLLAAINQYVERQEAEPIGRSLERVYPNFAQSWLSSRGAKELASADEQQDAAILDSTRADARIDSLLTTPEITRQCLNAIAEYIEQLFIETAIIQTLPALTHKLNQLAHKPVQTTRLDESLQAGAIDAIAEYIEQKSIEAAIIETLPALTHKLNQLTHKPTSAARLDESLPRQVVEAIAQYIEEQSIESAIIESLPALTQKFNQLAHKSVQTTRLDESKQAQAVEAIAEYIEQQSIESVIIETLPALTQKLNQLAKQKYGQSERLDESLPKQAIQSLASVIANYHEQVATLRVITPDFQKLVQQLVEISHSRLTKQLHQVEQAIEQHKPLVSRQTTTQLPPQVFMGSQPQPEKFQPIQNHGAVYKPIGGLWTSPYQLQHGSEWSAFVQKEGMTASPDKQQLWLVVPKPNLKILVVDSPEKLKSLPHLPPRIIGDNVCPIDYEAITLEYDALVIKPQLLRGSPEVATFDVESTIWFGSRGYPFASVEPLTHEGVKYWAGSPSIDSSPNQLLTLTSKNKEQVSVGESVTVKNLEKWKQVAIALGKPQAYINRVAATTKAVETGVPLPEFVVPSMQQDFQAYQQISNDLSVWYNAAKSMDKSEQYLSQIKQVTKAFHDPSVPAPLSPKAVGTMQQDLQKYEQLQMQHLWQHYSLAVEPVRPIMKANAVAHAALIDHHPTEMIYKIIKHDPQCAEIRQRSGEQAVQNHLKVSVQSALSKMQQQNKPDQVYQQRQSKQQPGFEL